MKLIKSFLLVLPIPTALMLASCGGFGGAIMSKDLSVTDPDQNHKISFALNDQGALSYSFGAVSARLEEGGPSIDYIKPSTLGFEIEGLGRVEDGFEITAVDKESKREIYDLPWGEVAHVDAPYREIQLSLKHVETGFLLEVHARVFADGLGLRYHIPEQNNTALGGDTIRILEELTGFHVSGDPMVNWGPGDWNSYENRLELTKLSAIEATKYDDRNQLIKRVVPHNAIMTPATMRLEPQRVPGAESIHLSIHEADLVDYPEMTLGVVIGSDPSFKSILAGSPNRKAKVVRKLPLTTPWRTVAVEKRAIDLVANTLVLNLNPPNKLGDISWFEPKTYGGVWWEMFLGKGTWDFASGQSAAGSAGEAETGESRHAANTANVKRYIDFCADNNIGGLLVEGWNEGWEIWLDSVKRLNAFDFVTPYPDYDLEEVVRYGKAKGVEIVMHHETSGVPERYEHQLDTAFALMKELGLHAVKSGYVGNFPNGEWHHGQYGVRHYRKVFETAAKYKVAVNPHEPIKPTGERRTLPNAISAEGARGMEYNAFGDFTQVNQPSHLPSIVYTRGLAGPFDYTPGIFNLEMEGWKGEDDEVLSTLGKQLGAYVVIMAPIQMVADIPEHYYVDGLDVKTSTGTLVAETDMNKSSYHPALNYISRMATTWDATYPLAGELADYAVVARKVRGEDRYFIGGVAGPHDREVSFPLSFLPAGNRYELTLYRDAADAHYRNNKAALFFEKKIVKSTDSISVNMKLAGGFGAILENVMVE